MKNARLDKWKLLTAAVVWLAIGVAGFVYFYDLNPERRIAEIIPIKTAHKLSEEAAVQVTSDLNALAQSSDAAVAFPQEMAGVKTSEAALNSYKSELQRQLDSSLSMATEYSIVYDENGQPIEGQTKITAKDLSFVVAPQGVDNPDISFASGDDIAIRLPILVTWEVSDLTGQGISNVDLYTSLLIDGETSEIKHVLGQ